MSRGVTWAALLTVTLGVVALVLWLAGQDGPGASDGRALVAPSAPGEAPATELPTGSAEPTIQPLQAAAPGAATAEAPAAAAAADDAPHAWPFRELSLSGRVVDSRGRPLRDAEVILDPSRQARRQHGFPEHYFMEPPAWDDYPRTVSASDGTFAFTAQEAGDIDGTRIPTPDDYAAATTLVARLPGHVPAAVLVPADGWTVPMGDVVLRDAGFVRGRLVDPDAVPLPGLRIAVGFYGRKDDGSDEPSWRLISWLIETRTQDDGRFLLDTLDPGRYRLEVQGEGHQPRFFEAEVSAGQTLDVGDLIVQPGRVLAGRVVDEDGVGLVGAALKARPSTLLNLARGEDTALRDIRVTVISSSGDREVTTESGPGGTFRFEDLVDTEYVVLASHEGRDPAQLRGLRPDRLDLELVLPEEALFVLRVIDRATRQPVFADVTIFRVSTRGATEPDPMDPSLSVAEHAAAAERLGLDEDGHGLYVAGPAGFVGHRLRIRSDEYAPLETTLPGLQAGEIHEQTFELIPASTISGRVRDGQGAPLAAARITVDPATPGSGTSAARRSARTAEDGTYTVGGLSEGEWTIRAALKDHIPMDAMPLTLGVAEQRADVELVLQRGARVSGIVLTPEGSPAPSHPVQAWAPGGSAESATSMDTRTGSDGRFLFSGLKDGPLTLNAEPGARAEVFARQELEAEVELVLRRPARLTGRVSDVSGAPLSCEVRYWAEGADWQTAETLSDAQGEYVLEDLPPGRGLVYAAHELSRTPVAGVDLDYGRAEVRDLRFSGGRITGRVVLDDTGATLASIRVRALGIEGGEGSTPRGIAAMGSEGVTDDQGHFVLGSLADGRYAVRTYSTEYVPLETGPRSVTLEGGSASLELRVTRSATLRGRTSTVGEPGDGTLSLRLVRISDGFERSGGLPFEGDYELSGIPAGEYRYEVKRNSQWPPLPDQDHVFASGELEFVSGQTTLHDIVLLRMER